MSACAPSGFWLVHPRGPVAGASLHYWIIDTAATFLVIGPTTLLVLWCIWRYRKATGQGTYRPGWAHSTPLEIIFWGFPMLIVGVMGYFTLVGSFETDPGYPTAIDRSRDPDGAAAPVDVDVLTTDWQWLFVYPGRHIAVSNELVIPVHTPVRFRLTSSTVATDFWIPQLVGQIDVMPGMRTKQALVANVTGDFEGFASDYNGPGFSWMRFGTKVVSPAAFTQWEDKVSQSPIHLDDASFRKFAAPTINEGGNSVEFSNVEDNLFEHVMGDTMSGLVYPTPPLMTEKMSHRVNGGKQPLVAHVAPARS